MSSIVVDERFCGPPQSGNGGYVCGLLAQFVEPTAAVRLELPPPLSRALRIEQSGDDTAVLFDGDQPVARAGASELDLEAPPWPGFEAAERAAKDFSGFEEHTFPSCFVCGPERAVGDGMRIFPGPLPDAPDRVAAPWIPDVSLGDEAGRVRSEFVWAALDCSGIFAFGLLANPTVLGALSVRIDARPEVEERCTVVGWRIGAEGRKRFAGTALYDEAGRPIALGHATWIEVAPAKS